LIIVSPLGATVGGGLVVGAGTELGIRKPSYTNNIADT
jgi:hypothetical protein